MINPAKYWRSAKQTKLYLGRKGTVVVVTYIRSAGMDHQSSTPYSFAVVELADGEKVELTGVGHEKLEVGDKIECVLRKIPPNDGAGLIEYIIKAKKI